MAGNNKLSLETVFLSGFGILAVGAIIYYLSAPDSEATAGIALKHEEAAVVDLGRGAYPKNGEPFHGVALERQADWQQRDANDYLPAPPYSETGH